MRRRRPKSRILLPGEKESRRGFLKKGLVGGLLLAAGGGSYLFTRKTVPLPGLAQDLRVLSAEEATVFLAIADRLVPEREHFPRPAAVGLATRIDELVAALPPATQKELHQLLRLFENALSGLVFEGVYQTFTASPPEAKDRRLAGWAQSRVALRRTGSRALRRLVHTAYYASPEVYPALGYPGPPAAGSPVRHSSDAPPPEQAEPRQEPPHRARSTSTPESRGEPTPEPDSEAKPEPKPAPKPEPTAPNAEPGAEPKTEPAPPPRRTRAKPRPPESEPVEPRPVDPELVAPPSVEPPPPKEQP
jgi:hypothetical protein